MTAQHPSSPVLRVISWDARTARPEPAVLRAIRAAAPDLALVHRAPTGWRWRSRCARLARECALLVVAGGRSAGGNLLLCDLRLAVVASAVRAGPLARVGAATAVLTLGGRELAALCTSDDRAGGQTSSDPAYDLVGWSSARGSALVAGSRLTVLSRQRLDHGGQRAGLELVELALTGEQMGVDRAY